MRLRKLLKLLIYIIICFLLAVNGYILVAKLYFNEDIPQVFGFSQLIVVSGSMEPALQAGDMIIIREQPDYQVGDIVTYRTGLRVVTHRIVDITENQAVLQGDANNVADKPIPVTAIVGKVVLRIPRAGDALLYARTPAGIVSVILSAVALLNLPRLLKRGKGKV